MIWLGWRQQRAETWIAVSLLALLAALLLPTGLHMLAVYDHEGLSACTRVETSACHTAIASFGNRFEHLGGLLGWFNLIPGVLGVLLAAPTLLDLEHGTYRLAWTQSVTRRTWVAAKLGLGMTAALVSAAVMAALLTWWRGPLDQLYGRMEINVFDYEGTVGFGYVLFAFGLALALGVVWRRTVPALLTAFAGYTVARVFVQSWLRQRFEAPLQATWPVARGAAGPDLGHAWVLVQEPSDRLGRPIDQGIGLLQSCSRAASNHVERVTAACLARHGAGYSHAVYQPAARFWLFQGIETALFGATALVLVGFAAWWIVRRTV